MSNLPIFDSFPLLDSPWPPNTTNVTTNVDETWQLPDLTAFDALPHQLNVTETQNPGPSPGEEMPGPQWGSTVDPPTEERTSSERVCPPLSGVSLRWNPCLNQRIEEELEQDSRNSLVLLELGSGSFGRVNLIFDKRKPEIYVRKTLTPLPTATLDKTVWEGQLASLKKMIRRRLLFSKDYYLIDREVLELSLTDYLYSPQMTPPILQSHSPYYFNNQNEDKSATVWDIISQVTSGLTFIHQNDVVHGNLKPSNVLYSLSSGSWKLTDLGLTSLMFKKAPNSISEFNLLGNQAPELFAPGSKPSVKSDTWSAGCLLHEMVALKKPFDSYSEMSEFCRGRDLIISSRLPLKPVAQESVSKIIRETLLLDPRNRPDSNALLDIFKRLLNDTVNTGRGQRVSEIRVANFGSPNYHFTRAQEEATHSRRGSPRSRRPLRGSRPVVRKYNTRSNGNGSFKCPSRGCSNFHV